MLNDATALVLFKFSLAAFITSQFSTVSAISTFFIIVIGESLYGLALGYIIGELRLKLNDPILHIIISLLTPFIAYLPPERLGGSGILATVITGLIIGHFYSEHYSPSARLIGRAVWQTLGFALMSLLFLLVGLNFRTTLQHISSIPLEQLILYSTVITLTVIIGRFVWVYGSLYITHIVLIFLGKKYPYPPWQYPFVVAWAGMRGGISLAAALAVPTLLLVIDGTDARNLLIFLVFCVITATLILQGLALPWVLQKLGIIKAGQSERYQEHVVELKARLALIKAVLNWLKEYAILVQDDAKITDEVKFHIQRYKELKKRLHERIIMHTDENKHNEIIEAYEEIIVAAQIIKVERIALANLWREGKITHAVRNKLLQHLDLRSRHLE
jgi:CPA1 family monovalent cation:H+ antiporter